MLIYLCFRALKVAYNSLGGMASVNHYHFHIYYLHHPLFIETAVSVALKFTYLAFFLFLWLFLTNLYTFFLKVCEHLVGPLYAFKDHYAPGFVFQLDRSDIGTTAK